MHVHVHGLDRERDVQDARREAARHHLVFIGLLQRGAERPRFDEAAVDEEKLQAPVAAGRGRLCDKAADRNFFPPAFHRRQIVCKLPPEHLIDRAAAVAVARGVELLNAVL